MENSGHRFRNVALALAGVVQAIDVMNKLARTGHLSTREFTVAVNSLFEQNPADTESVYGGAANLERGLTVLIDLLKNRHDHEHAPIISYCLGIVHLQGKLYKNKTMLNTVGARLEKAHQQAQHFSVTHENVIANLASIYTDTISTFTYRIQVIGDYQYLQQQRIADQVRVLLLAAIRSAILWRQVGGGRLQLLLQRSNILAAAEPILDEIRRAQTH